jgi:hypothetical protein
MCKVYLQCKEAENNNYQTGMIYIKTHKYQEGMKTSAKQYLLNRHDLASRPQ